jgi:hypothetical protein
VNRQRRIHWAWIPAAVFCTVVGWIRWGAWVLLAVAAGAALGLSLEWRARRRDREAATERSAEETLRSASTSTGESDGS